MRLLIIFLFFISIIPKDGLCWHNLLRVLIDRSMESQFVRMMDLILERLMLADGVARSKWDSGKPIEDIPREAIILQKISKIGMDKGLDEKWIKLFFQNQIDANKYVQRGLHDLWKMKKMRDQIPAPDLASEIRPKIDRLNESILNLAVESTNTRSRSCCGSYILKHKDRYKLDQLHHEAFDLALKNVCIN